MTSFQQFLLVVALCIAVHSESASAFQSASAVPSHFLAKQQSRYSGQKNIVMPLHLTPDQASDLEACAYDLMKEAVEETRIAVALDGQPVMEASSSSPGPVGWCRRFAQDTIEQQQQNLRP